MKTLVVARFVSLMAVAPMLLSGQMLRDNAPLRHWPAPLYWQPNLEELHPLAATPTQPSPLTFIAMTPCRVVDTRVGSGFSGQFGPPSLVGGMSRTFPIQSSSTCSIPAAAQAYSLNITVVPPGPIGFLTAYPTGQPLPLAAMLVWSQGYITSNAAIAPGGTSGSVDVYANSATDLIIDINGYYASQTDLNSNTAVGQSALISNTTGNNNTASGTDALYNNTTGSYNTANGVLALARNTTGSTNTASGDSALYNNTTGSGNTASGFNALSSNTTGRNNTASGINALLGNTTGIENTATGINALAYNTTGNNNTASGAYALNNNITGGGNIALGYEAGYNLTTGSNNIDIGNQGTPSDSGAIRIGASGSQSSFFVAGVRGVTTSNNDAVPVVIDSAGQLGTVSSSRRYKEYIQDMGDASGGLMHLRPVTFRYQKPFADGSKPVQYGLIAEEVAEVYPDLVAHSADGQIETVKYQVLDSMLLNEVQRQQKEITSLNEQNQALQERLSKLEAVMAKTAGGAGAQ